MSEITIRYPTELPVSARREDIAAALRENQVVIVAGATGSGKTTQLPKICLELGRESIAHTQPRRIAARTIAERIAEELDDEVGGLVGYQVRFTDRASASTRIKLMTDGILLNEMNHDRMLSRYDTIIIDEAHERSLTIDFLLGYLRRLLPQRPDLKVIITSATIDPESFARHFADASGTPAPVIEVSGRTYPVEIRYRPLFAEEPEEEDDTDTPDATSGSRDLMTGIIDALAELAREDPGDVLVFLSGENEIRDAEDTIRGQNLSGTEVLPLYGRLSAADQHRVFEHARTPGIRRRVVLATNVAETSLTVPGIRYVIDGGTARISRYSARSKVQRLPIEAVSQASANQRSGRSGRTSPGIAIRLYSEEDFLRRPEFTDPEILRTGLAAVILQMISLGLGDIASFPFLTPPDSRGIKDGLDLLTELGALRAPVVPPPRDATYDHDTPKKNVTSGISRRGDDGGRLTRIGRDLARLPIDPRFGRMVIESRKHGVTREVMAIVAGLTIQDVRERPLERRAQADQQHARFVDPSSDFLTLLNLWNHLEKKQQELSSSAFRRMCKAEYLNYLRVREWQDVVRQLRQLARPLTLELNEPQIDPDGIHRSLLAGLLSHLGIKDTTSQQAQRAAKNRERQNVQYLGARNAKFWIFPGSAVAKKLPDAVMSAELVETSRLFARSNAAIDPAWAEPIAGDLVKRHFSEPHWEKSQGAAIAYEKVTLYGVPIIPRRRVQFSRIDPAYARELFLRHALVEGEWESRHAFDRKNRALRAELEQLEERTRRRDLLVDDEAVVDFYDRRIPRNITSVRSFDSWWRTAQHDDPDLLTMTQETLLPEDADEIDETAFPTQWRQADQRFRLSYRFEPGMEDDGVTVHVPLALLPRVSPLGFDWLVPGLRDELVAAMIKALPKHVRRNVVPANDWARALTAALPRDVPNPPTESFPATLAGVIRREAGVVVRAEDFDLERIPAHLRVTFAVSDERGRSIAAGKELAPLVERLRGRVRDEVARVVEARVPDALERRGLTTWDLPELPRVTDIRQGGNTIRAYPALVDDGDSVSIRLLATAEEQADEHPRGVRRLLLLATPSPVAYVQQHLTSNEKLVLAQSPYQNTTALFTDCLVASIDAVLWRMKPGGMLFLRAEFTAVRDRVSASVMDSMFETVKTVTTIHTTARGVEKALKTATSMTLLPALTDAREQLSGLIYPGFVSATGIERLRHLPRYLAGITERFGTIGENVGRDRVWLNEVQAVHELYRSAGGAIPLPPHAPEKLTRARWLMEELRISLFAQRLGTAESVSRQRISKVLAG
ncbi:ATP-dependent RNA helicase HrpA [Rathayibacter toxicus]|uniref:ATP-dependent RNA helicase HrpA n=1 Tax=Rathayibacter toxicus TaxID=145458 RepID=A0A2S5Y956_9MICO|nr:ATP-dependent RNA helicase HrpA [Rathayibacter toxicus]PPH25023.1 ATP-dependent RNA helicase HrpA [Rathayibacter toxicus]PPH58949.1 ATP-dependent RNA helicase HrpA [Rathayibacter toxicus]PPH60943.1 ATP-dependent RNA helicase HrpA [Rathayibacter toxicus]PPH88763.1 ATP-dependent RNA helicase HrpA [Rathayibacter toxicus]PPI16455.1 ATP-dependent RNA helicase HrpA [Rathayibacter toxicus]